MKARCDLKNESSLKKKLTIDQHKKNSPTIKFEKKNCFFADKIFFPKKFSPTYFFLIGPQIFFKTKKNTFSPKKNRPKKLEIFKKKLSKKIDHKKN